ncbi:hypothetical protein LO80_01880 [Candidatus Francisella endociliophora]|uniref:Uncharacterized protein n=1 Tax=Candidatus Francisella endociliophora TaxID=653937 RepID=A0A097EMR9_9GAMM|nr:hypothetical protein [Francisella sp. FSC1006]AIT08848.1 hypothetical protein LO80_01880 [Francisella sp. FSC1006]
MKTMIITLSVIFILIASFTVGRAMGIFGPSQSSINEVGEKAAAQLESAYDKKFVVVADSGRYATGNQSYEFKMYPADDKDYKFSVTTDAYGRVEFSTYDVNHYKIKEWEDKYICPYLDKISKNNTCGSMVAVAGGINNSDFDAAKATLNKYPTFMEAIEHSTRGLQVGAGGNVKFDITPQNILKLMEETYKLGKFLDQYKFYQTSIRIRICNPKDKEGHCTYWGGIATKDWSYMPEANKENGWIEKENIKNWQSPLDLANFTKVDTGEPYHDLVPVSQSEMWPEIQRLYKEQQA